MYFIRCLRKKIEPVRKGVVAAIALTENCADLNEDKNVKEAITIRAPKNEDKDVTVIKSYTLRKNRNSLNEAGLIVALFIVSVKDINVKEDTDKGMALAFFKKEGFNEGLHKVMGTF